MTAPLVPLDVLLTELRDLSKPVHPIVALAAADLLESQARQIVGLRDALGLDDGGAL